MECHLCQRIAKALHSSGGFRVPRYYDTEGTRFVELSSWKELRENESCSTCSSIADYFKNELKDNEPSNEAAERQFRLRDFWGGDYVVLGLVSTDASLPFNFTIYPLAEGYSNSVGVRMDPQWVDLKRVSEWIKCCDTTHGKCYCRKFNSREPLPYKHMFLIDLSQNCLVEANGGEKYVALSYVWGREQQPFRTSRANLTLLRSNGGLARIKEKLPGTVQRAMHFTSMLGLELLWVDILCIVVDDPIHTATQIDDMAAIYSNSYLTVCAADGIDSSSGLRGVPECVQPRDVKQNVLTFNNGAMTSSWVMRVIGEASVYHKRAWTFQEHFLSRRTLFFLDRGLKWVCQELISEEQCLSAKKPGETVDGTLRVDVSWPSLKEWDNIVSDYLGRKLTYEADILRAFSGILRTLGRSMSGGFHFGLPELFFDATLLWIPTETLTRREDLKNGNQKYEFPSWSWVGWKGEIQNQVNAFGVQHERSTPYANFPRNRDIFPQVDYYKIEIGDNNEEHLVRISNDYASYQSEGLAGSLSLPLGWSSYRDEDDGTFYYRYDKAPTHTFWYPIPTVQDIPPGTRRQCDPCLFFITLRGYLDIASPLSKEEQNGRNYPLYHLHTENQEWAGVIYVHQPLSLSSGQTHRCELIVISAGGASEVEIYDTDLHEKQVEWLPEFNFAGRPRSGDTYHFYHVLWIERKDGISFRKGLGRVVKDVWDDLPEDNMQILLG